MAARTANRPTNDTIRGDAKDIILKPDATGIIQFGEIAKPSHSGSDALNNLYGDAIMKTIYVLALALALPALATVDSTPAVAQAGPNVMPPVVNDAARQNMDAAKKATEDERRKAQAAEEAKKKAMTGK